MSHAGKVVKAKGKEQTIKITVTFFTDGIDPQKRKGYIVPKHAWPNGTVQIERNESHGIVPARAGHFGSPMEIPLAIEKLLIDHGIKIHLARRPADYFE